VAFAPYEKPEIAGAVVVEHGGGGGAVAAPIAGKILRSYFDLQKPPPPPKPKEVSQDEEQAVPTHEHVPSQEKTEPQQGDGE
jgi:penicillin-binding protein 2